jgi:hypothetical protein
MSSHIYDYLDGNAAAGELSKIFGLDVTAEKDNVHIVVQQNALPKLICTCSARELWPDAHFASRYYFV